MTRPKALVIGASRGIGHGLAEQLAKAGYNTYRTVRSEPTDSKTFRVDFNDLDAESAKLAAAKFDSLDLLILNGAIGRGDSLDHISPETHRAYYQTNVIGPVAAVQAFLPALRKGQQKLIVFISSKAGQTHFQLENMRKPEEKRFPLSNGPYGATKAALNMVGVQLWGALSKEGFSILLIHPGVVRTDMASKFCAWVDANPDKVPNSDRAVTVEESASGIVKVLQSSIAAGKPEIRFVSFEGEELQV